MIVNNFIIFNLYWHQTAEAGVQQATADALWMKRRTFPIHLFVGSLREALDTMTGGNTVNYIRINSILYADDTQQIT